MVDIGIISNVARVTGLAVARLTALRQEPIEY
jgi:hypothetical protein